MAPSASNHRLDYSVAVHFKTCCFLYHSYCTVIHDFWDIYDKLKLHNFFFEKTLLQ